MSRHTHEQEDDDDEEPKAKEPEMPNFMEGGSQEGTYQNPKIEDILN